MKHFLYPLVLSLATTFCTTPASLRAADGDQASPLHDKIVTSVLLFAFTTAAGYMSLHEPLQWPDGQSVPAESLWGLFLLVNLAGIWLP